MNRAWMTAAVVIALVFAATPTFAGGLKISIGGVVVVIGDGGRYAPAPAYVPPPQPVVVYQPPPQVVYQQPAPYGYQPAPQPVVVYQQAYQPAYQSAYQPAYRPACPQQVMTYQRPPVTWRGHWTYTPVYDRGVCTTYRQMWVHD